MHWVTGTSAPCLSLFKPIVIGVQAPIGADRPTDRYDAQSLWWRHERLHRTALHDLPAALSAFREARDALEAEFRNRMTTASGDRRDLAAAIRSCWSDAEALEREWERAISSRSPMRQHRMQPPTARAWARLNRAAALGET